MSETWLYWVGCAGAFDQRNQQVALALTGLLGLAEVPFITLGTDEKCCGDPARRLGNEFLVQSLAEENTAAIIAAETRHVVATCPHCYRVLKREYELPGVEVLHHSQLLARLLGEGRLPRGSSSTYGRTAYHDSCYLGRYEDIYEEPRTALRSVHGLELIELPRSRANSFCCGGGGGRVFLEEPEGERINHLRTDEAIHAGVDTLVTACPYCMTMLSDGARDKGDAFGVLDLAELLARQAGTLDGSRGSVAEDPVAD
jgi:Fe-S oxidoreductase